MFTKVAGVSHRNNDGTSRQAIIARCQVGERLLLEHDPDNPYDVNAIRVLRQSGEQLGYLSRELAGEVVSRARKGIRYVAFIKDLTGGESDKPTRGVNLLVFLDTEDAGDEELRASADRLLAATASSGRGGGCMTAVIAAAGLAVLALVVFARS
jgi:hypothetical protein